MTSYDIHIHNFGHAKSEPSFSPQVNMIISGEYDETDIREVNHNIKKKTLQRGTIDIFVMAVPRYDYQVLVDRLTILIQLLYQLFQEHLYSFFTSIRERSLFTAGGGGANKGGQKF